MAVPGELQRSAPPQGPWVLRRAARPDLSLLEMLFQLLAGQTGTVNQRDTQVWEAHQARRGEAWTPAACRAAQPHPWAHAPPGGSRCPQSYIVQSARPKWAPVALPQPGPTAAGGTQRWPRPGPRGHHTRLPVGHLGSGGGIRRRRRGLPSCSERLPSSLTSPRITSRLVNTQAPTVLMHALGLPGCFNCLQ